MNEHAYFHWDLLRQPLQTSQFGMGAPFFDVNSILEIRKEKSRDAARSRRGKENYEFYELAKLLPLPAAITSQLDKASIIRLTISYLKLRDFSCHGDPQWTQEGGPGINKISKTHQSRLDLMDPFESRQGTHILQSLDGFAFILANDGRFLYISETVSIYLGLSQVEMAGSSIFEYVHPQDHSELAEQLGMCLVPVGPSGSSPGSGSEDGSSPATPRPGSPTEKGYIMISGPDKNIHKSFALRMKSTLTKRGVHVKTSGYRVVHVLGTLRSQSPFGPSRSGCHGSNNSSTSSNNGTSTNSSQPPLLGLVAMAIALPPPTITELRLELDTFITRLSPDFKVIYCEPVISDLMDLSVEDVTDRLLYDICHAADLKNLRRSHLDILNKGQALTDYYRLMNRHGGYIWIQTCATTLLNNKNSDDQSILAINFVVSGLEDKNCPVDLWQLTGDVTAAMSSSSNSQSRQEKLNELKSKKSSGTLVSKNKILSPNVKNISSSPTALPGEPSNGEYRATSEISCPKIPAENSGEDTEVSSPEKNCGSLDSKTKRRKMENPRKRKRSNCDPLNTDQSEKAVNLTQADNKTSVITSASQNLNTVAQGVEKILEDHRILPNVAPSLSTETIMSSPEDLSVKRTLRKSPDRNIIQHSSSVFKGAPSQNSEKHKSTTFMDAHDGHSSSQIAVTGSSVKELEAAMNRHLPASVSTIAFGTQNDRSPFDSSLVDSAGAGKGFPGLGSNCQSSSSSWLPSSRASGSDMLTASNFLRSLYANRESVIKTNSRSQPPFLNNDPPASLLTPPEPDPSTYRDYGNTYPYGKPDFSGHSHIYDRDSGLETRDHMYKDQNHRDQFSFIPYKDHIPAAYIDHISSTMYKDHFTSNYKELSPYKDIIPAFTIPSLMSPAGRMHQAYSSFHHHFTVPFTSSTMDACSITPPSSNSPDVNKHTSSSHHFDTTSFTSELTDACNLSQKQMVNSSLSPAASSSPTASGHHYQHYRHQREHVYQGINCSDSPKSGYHGICGSATGPVYTDLHQTGSGPAQYEACTRPILPWY